MLIAARPRTLGVVLVAVLAGCWVPKDEGERLKTAAAARDVRLDELEKQNRENRDTLDAKILELETLIEQATRVLQRSSADVGAQVDTMRSQIESLEGQLAELRHELETFQRDEAEKRAALEQRLNGGGGAPALAANAVPEGAAQHFELAFSKFNEGNYAESRSLFKAYLERYPDDDKAGNAQYWVAATYLQESKPATALGEYRKVISEYSKSGAVNVALYGMADAFYRLHACTDAKAAISALLKRKPKADLTQRAKALLQEIKQAKRGYCTS